MQVNRPIEMIVTSSVDDQRSLRHFSSITDINIMMTMTGALSVSPAWIVWCGACLQSEEFPVCDYANSQVVLSLDDRKLYPSRGGVHSLLLPFVHQVGNCSRSEEIEEGCMRLEGISSSRNNWDSLADVVVGPRRNMVSLHQGNNTPVDRMGLLWKYAWAEIDE